MEKQPNDIVLCKLNVVVMPQGEVICLGKTLGWFRDLKEQLTPVSDLAGQPITEEDL